jgi:thymidylate kinase
VNQTKNNLDTTRLSILFKINVQRSLKRKRKRKRKRNFRKSMSYQKLRKLISIV